MAFDFCSPRRRHQESLRTFAPVSTCVATADISSLRPVSTLAAINIAWSEDAAPWKVQPAPLPEWLSKVITEPAAPSPPPSSSASSSAEPNDDRFARCLQSLLRIKTPDGKDGSKRLFTAACRCVEHALADSEAVACIRSYSSAKPFPRQYDDNAIVSRLRDAEKRAESGAALKKNKPTKNGDGDGERGPSQAQQLIELGEAAELWHTPAADGFATVTVGDHVEHYPVRSRHFRLWLDHQFFLSTGGAPNSEARSSALSVLEAKARFEGDEHAVFLRVAPHDGGIVIDMADAAWQAIEVTADGWQVIDNPPVRFRRAKAMLPMPMPAAGGSIGELRQFINVTDEHYPLVLASLVAYLRPVGPYPVLCLHGEQGSGKSTQAKMLRLLIDPNTAPIRSEPKEPRDLMIAANNGWLIALDNLSHVPSWLSDCLCRLSTGGGFSTRTLYENDEETIFDATRPVILTGIEELATRGDLIDRSLLVNLPVIPEHHRRPEAELWAEFNQALPRIFGALLDAVSGAIRNLPTTKLDRLPRMADFALWSTAAEPALGLSAGEFIAAYTGNRETANVSVLECSPVAKYIFDVAQGDGWSGTASELLAQFNEQAGFERTDGKPGKKPPEGWPKSPRSLSGTLKRLAPNLRQAGIEVEYDRVGRDRRRVISIRAAEKVAETSSAPSAPSADREITAETADATTDANSAPSPYRPQHRPHETAENTEEKRSCGRNGRCGRKIPHSVGCRTTKEGDPMNDPIDVLLATLTRQGVVLTADGDNLGIDAPDDVLTPELIERLKWHKFDILDRLRRTMPCHSMHFMPVNWRDESPRAGRIRTVCRVCGKFIGYRPIEPSNN